MPSLREVKEQFFIYDTVQLDKQYRRVFSNIVRDERKNNMLDACLIGTERPIDQMTVFKGIAVGGALDVLRRFAERVQLTFDVGQKWMQMFPLWQPPDRVLTPTELREKTRTFDFLHGKSVGDVPDDWQFLCWDVAPVIVASPRQCFSLCLETFGDALPEGEIRVVIGGKIRRGA